MLLFLSCRRHSKTPVRYKAPNIQTPVLKKTISDISIWSKFKNDLYHKPSFKQRTTEDPENETFLVKLNRKALPVAEKIINFFKPTTDEYRNAASKRKLLRSKVENTHLLAYTREPIPKRDIFDHEPLFIPTVDISSDAIPDNLKDYEKKYAFIKNYTKNRFISNPRIYVKNLPFDVRIENILDIFRDFELASISQPILLRKGGAYVLFNDEYTARLALETLNSTWFEDNCLSMSLHYSDKNVIRFKKYPYYNLNMNKSWPILRSGRGDPQTDRQYAKQVKRK